MLSTFPFVALFRLRSVFLNSYSKYTTPRRERTGSYVLSFRVFWPYAPPVSCGIIRTWLGKDQGFHADRPLSREISRLPGGVPARPSELEGENEVLVRVMSLASPETVPRARSSGPRTPTTARIRNRR